MGRFSKAADVVIAALIIASSASVAYDLLAERRLNTLVGQLPPAVMAACGRGLVEPITPSPALQEFQRRARPSVSCADAVGDSRTRTPDSEVMSTRYADYAVAFAFRLGGISWRTIDACLAIVFGLSMTLAYALFRLVTGRVLSAIGVALLVFSPHALSVALPYRDFSKEFWFLAGWLGIAVLLRRGRPLASPAIYLPAVATGLVLGLGLGFRVDMAIIVPAVVFVIAAGVRGMTRAAVKVKAIAAGAFVLTYSVAGAPILTTLAAESSVSHVMVLGLVTPFTDALGLDSPPYDFGNLYSDDFAVETIHAHALLVDHDESLGELRTRAYDRQGMSLLRDAAWHFPADFAVRGLGATRQAIVNPFDPQTTTETNSMPALANNPVRRLLLRGRNATAGWLHGYELLLVAVAFFAVAVRDRWLAAVTTLLVLYFPGYSMLQFSRRHTFHLDVVAVGVMLVAVSGGAALVARLWREHRAGTLGRVWAEFVAPAVLGVMTGAILWGAGAGSLKVMRAWQQRQVTSVFERTLSGPAVEVAMVPAPLAQPAPTGPTHGTWERMAQYRPGIWSPAVLLSPAPGAWPAARSGVRLNAEYLIIDVSSSGCTSEPLPIMVKYSTVPNAPSEDLTRAFYLPVGSDWQLLVPIIEIPGASRFDGLAVPAALVPCVHRMRRVTPPESTPFPSVFAVLSPDWKSAPLYQRLRDTPVPPGELAIILNGQ